MGEFDGKVVLVTGAGSGIGRASAEAFGREGASVAVADIDRSVAEETAEAIVKAGGTAEPFTADVADEDAVNALIGAVVERFGGLDVAHNNAGIEGAHLPMAEMPLEDWQRTLAVNLTGVFLCMKAEIPVMLERGGAIVNTASASGLVGGWNLAGYTAAKHGVVGLTRAAACDYGERGIRINAVCPGAIDTPFLAELPQPFLQRLTEGHPIGRLGRAEEIADAVLWLASDRASFVIGQALQVDGGVVMGSPSTKPLDL
ncbi:SDR family NAD(P)-dependent oxidoreductase [Actinomadura sp. SCN-SB]|uniref:SDR family NAD(P)-dependent oxidoreductase n=1 Tax=Actinomadura sp. SCN-SB TaxID=3373092 RepID=UPI0037504BEE